MLRRIANDRPVVLLHIHTASEGSIIRWGAETALLQATTGPSGDIVRHVVTMRLAYMMLHALMDIPGENENVILDQITMITSQAPDPTVAVDALVLAADTASGRPYLLLSEAITRLASRRARMADLADDESGA